MHHTRHQVKYLMINLFSKVRKYGRPMRSSNQCHREHPRRIRARHPRDKGTIGQIDKFVWKPYQNQGSASSRPITLAKSTGLSTIRSDYELSATRNWSPQPTATKAHNSACFHGNISTCWSVKRLKRQTYRTKEWQGQATMGPHHLHRTVPKASRDWSHRASSIGTSQAPISKMVQCPHSMRLPWQESRSSHEKLHCTQIQGPRSDQRWKTEVWGFGYTSWSRRLV